MGYCIPGNSRLHWEELLPRVAGCPAITRIYHKAHDEVAEAMARGENTRWPGLRHACPSALADPIILGPVMSQRRHLILDGICMAIGLARAIRMNQRDR